ncbi:MAG: 2Fe-2S iron-sulfur cluster-binding protein [Desulfobacterales bacterium]|jgi:predicted molibdopterin-dependent oxidoreductase YjgC
MKSVTIIVDDQPYQAQKDQTVLHVLREHDIRVPTLCFHPALKPSGSCKLCAVEVEGRASARHITMLACILKVREGLVTRTQGELVTRARRKAFEDLLVQAPQSPAIRELAQSFQIDLGPMPDGCIRCRLCIRVCKEVVGAGALKMTQRNGRSYVVAAKGACIGCGTCVNLCPTNAIAMIEENNLRTISIRDEIIGIHPLERCEGCGRMFATHRFLVKLQERIADHPHVKEPHRYCQNCAKMFSDRVRTFGERKHAPSPKH